MVAYTKLLERKRREDEEIKSVLSKTFDTRFINDVKRLNQYKTLIDSESSVLSVSGGVFLGHYEKEAANTLSKRAVANMEDDVIFDVISQFKQKDNDFLPKTRIFRVICDPYEINEEVKLFLNKHKDVANIDYYVSAIRWGLSDYNNKTLSEYASYADLSVSQNLKSFFYAVNVGDKKIIVDPFWREIGIDFLMTTCTQESLSVFKKEFVEINGDKAKEEEKIKEYLSNNNVFKSMFKENSIDLNIWIRTGAWRGNSYNILNTLIEDHGFLKGANADRAIYVSSNFFVLQDNANSILHYSDNFCCNDLICSTTRTTLFSSISTG